MNYSLKVIKPVMEQLNKVINDEEKQRADYDGDNEVTANDYALIKKYIMER